MIRDILALIGLGAIAGVALGIYELRKHGVTLAMVKAALGDLKRGG